MKPARASAKEKKKQGEKRGGEKAKSESQDCCVIVNH